MRFSGVCYCFPCWEIALSLRLAVGWLIGALNAGVLIVHRLPTCEVGSLFATAENQTRARLHVNHQERREPARGERKAQEGVRKSESERARERTERKKL